MSRSRFSQLGTTVVAAVTDPRHLDAAEHAVRRYLDQLDQTCSRHRRDSELVRLASHAGRRVRVSPLLMQVLLDALRAHELTDGAVDPTTAPTRDDLQPDRNADRRAAMSSSGHVTPPAPGPDRIELDVDARTVVLPTGTWLDLNATATAVVVDHAASVIAEHLGSGVLLRVGGKIAVCGPPPAGGRPVNLGGHDRPPDPDPPAGPSRPLDEESEVAQPAHLGQTRVAIHDGGLSTSSITSAAWHTGDRDDRLAGVGGVDRHIRDPRSGALVEPVWRSVTVAAQSCVDANAASTAAHVLGDKAAPWLEDHRLPALLRAPDGRHLLVAGWPPAPLADQHHAASDPPHLA